jgi:hypothetical protein
VLRLVSDKLSRLWNQRVVIDNKPGGGGFIAIDQARRAAPDGYTLLQLDSEHIAALPHLYKSKNFVTLQHFDPVASLFRTPFFVAVATDSKWKTMGDLIAAAKAAARASPTARGAWAARATWARSSWRRSPASACSTRRTARCRSCIPTWARARCRGPSPAFRRARASTRPASCATSPWPRPSAFRRCPTCRPWPRRAGRLRAGSQLLRLAARAQGRAGGVKAKINADVAKVIADPEIRARFDTFAFEPLAWSPEEIERNAEAKSKVYGELVRRGNISLE